MARPLQDGSRHAAPTAAVPGSPGGPLGGRTLALPPPGCRSPPGLSCALCPARAPRPPRPLHRSSRRAPEQTTRDSRPAEEEHGSLAAVQSSLGQEPPWEEQALRRRAAGAAAAQSNGHLSPSTRPSLEQALGARLRHMGDLFHQEHQRRHLRHQQQRRPAWDHFCHFFFQLLGLFYNVPAERGVGLGPN